MFLTEMCCFLFSTKIPVSTGEGDDPGDLLVVLHHVQVILHQGPLPCQQGDAVVIDPNVTNPTILSLTLKIGEKVQGHKNPDEVVIYWIYKYTTNIK